MIELVTDPEPQVGCDLIVPRSSCVKLASDVSERIDQGLLDVHVDVFEFDAKRELLAIDSLLDTQEFPFDLGEL
jgi:hypothetical protein